MGCGPKGGNKYNGLVAEIRQEVANAEALGEKELRDRPSRPGDRSGMVGEDETGTEHKSAILQRELRI